MYATSFPRQIIPSIGNLQCCIFLIIHRNSKNKLYQTNYSKFDSSLLPKNSNLQIFDQKV